MCWRSLWSVECGECGVWSEECVKCRAWWSVECGVWGVCFDTFIGFDFCSILIPSVSARHQTIHSGSWDVRFLAGSNACSAQAQFAFKNQSSSIARFAKSITSPAHLRNIFAKFSRLIFCCAWTFRIFCSATCRFVTGRWNWGRTLLPFCSPQNSRQMCLHPTHIWCISISAS